MQTDSGACRIANDLLEPAGVSAITRSQTFALWSEMCYRRRKSLKLGGCSPAGLSSIPVRVDADSTVFSPRPKKPWTEAGGVYRFFVWFTQRRCPMCDTAMQPRDQPTS